MKRVLLAMSGGVDSSVAAYILKREGFNVIGATIKTWSSDECRDERSKGCCSIQDIDDARSVAGKLNIPHYVMDLSSDFKEKVIDYFINSYLDGKTPNPCIACNKYIKFGIFLKKAEELEAEYIATGHYARRMWDKDKGRWTVQVAKDQTKDQSYVLFSLTQYQLSKTLLPVGEYTKSEIRDMAHQLGLRNFDKPDSQEICFVSKHYGDFIQKNRSDLPGKGKIVDQKGNILGDHDGYYLYTIGQRKRIGSIHSTPYFVTSINKESNEVVVGDEKSLYKKTMEIQKMNWTIEPRLKQSYEVKIRSRIHRSRGELLQFTKESAIFEFELPEKAISPGQAAVIYDGPNVIGGGWIEKSY